MEGLVVFIIFIVVSLIRSLSQNAQQQGSAQQRPGQAQRPTQVGQPRQTMRPQVEPKVASKPEILQEDSGSIVSSDESRWTQKLEDLRKAERKSQQGKTQRKPQEVVNAETPAATVLSLDAQKVVSGIVFAEILGPPRALKPWRGQQHR